MSKIPKPSRRTSNPAEEQIKICLYVTLIQIQYLKSVLLESNTGKFSLYVVIRDIDILAMVIEGLLNE